MRGVRILSQPELLSNLGYDFLGGCGDRDRYRIFRLFEIRELANQNGLACEMPTSRPQAISNEIGFASKVDISYFGCVELVAVSSLQRRAREHCISTCRYPTENRRMEVCQPWFSVSVRERDAITDLLDV